MFVCFLICTLILQIYCQPNTKSILTSLLERQLWDIQVNKEKTTDGEQSFHFPPCYILKMLLCSQDRSIQYIWHVFKDKHGKSFVYSPAFSLAYWSSKVTISDCCKFSFEFFFPYSKPTKVRWEKEKTKARALYSQGCLQLISENLLQAFSKTADQ